MLQTLNLKCANCGANLEIKPDAADFACGYCGASQMIERSGGTISLRLLTNSISKVQIGTDKTAAELAIRRLKEEMVDVKSQYSVTMLNRNKEIDSNIRIFLIPGGIVLLLIFVALLSISGILAFFVTITIAAGIIFLWYKIDQGILLLHKPRIERIKQQQKSLQMKLVEQKNIVDS